MSEQASPQPREIAEQRGDFMLLPPLTPTFGRPAMLQQAPADYLVTRRPTAVTTAGLAHAVDVELLGRVKGRARRARARRLNSPADLDHLVTPPELDVADDAREETAPLPAPPAPRVLLSAPAGAKPRRSVPASMPTRIDVRRAVSAPAPTRSAEDEGIVEPSIDLDAALAELPASTFPGVGQSAPVVRRRRGADVPAPTQAEPPTQFEPVAEASESILEHPPADVVVPREGDEPPAIRRRQPRGRVHQPPEELLSPTSLEAPSFNPSGSTENLRATRPASESVDPSASVSSSSELVHRTGDDEAVDPASSDSPSRTSQPSLVEGRVRHASPTASPPTAPPVSSAPGPDAMMDKPAITPMPAPMPGPTSQGPSEPAVPADSPAAPASPASPGASGIQRRARDASGSADSSGSGPLGSSGTPAVGALDVSGTSSTQVSSASSTAATPLSRPLVGESSLVPSDSPASPASPGASGIQRRARDASGSADSSASESSGSPTSASMSDSTASSSGAPSSMVSSAVATDAPGESHSSLSRPLVGEEPPLVSQSLAAGKDSPPVRSPGLDDKELPTPSVELQMQSADSTSQLRSPDISTTPRVAMQMESARLDEAHGVAPMVAGLRIDDSASASVARVSAAEPGARGMEAGASSAVGPSGTALSPRGGEPRSYGAKSDSTPTRPTLASSGRTGIQRRARSGEASPARGLAGLGAMPEPRVQGPRRIAVPEPVRQILRETVGEPPAHVTVHEGGAAGEKTDSVNAEAFTRDGQIYFANDAPVDSPRGQQLLAHELTHVMQQQGRPGSMPGEHTQEGQDLEQAARQVEDHMVNGRGRLARAVVRAPKSEGEEPAPLHHRTGSIDAPSMRSSGGGAVTSSGSQAITPPGSGSIVSSSAHGVDAGVQRKEREPSRAILDGIGDTASKAWSKSRESLLGQMEQEFSGPPKSSKEPDSRAKQLERQAADLYPYLRRRLRSELVRDLERRGRL